MQLDQININTNRIFDFTAPDSKAIQNLVSVSNEKSLSLNSIIDNDTVIDKTKYPKKVDCAWCYGTKYWDMLDEKQKLEVLWAEVARDVSMSNRFLRFMSDILINIEQGLRKKHTNI